MELNYKELLDTALEIEGLLMVQIDRKDQHSDHVDDLIARKLASLQAHFSAEVVNDDDDEAIAEAAQEEETEMAEVAQPEHEETNETDEPEADMDITMSAPMSESVKLDERLARDRAKDIFKAFTLNDKFRFRRELFNNSQAEFEDALEVIAGMNTIDEAKEYFIDDLCWDASNEDVKAFMEILAKHF